MEIFNHDLLNNPGDVGRARQLYPDVVDFLDWPELRQAFDPHDLKANKLKRDARRRGYLAVACGVLALWLAAIEPRLHDILDVPHFSTVFSVVIVAFGFVGIILGGSLLRGRAKEEWLHRRAATERLRQLHFQFLVRRATGIGAANTADRKRALDEERERLLIKLRGNLEYGKAPVVEKIVEDLGGSDAWLVDESDASPSVPSSKIVDQLLEAYKHLRFDHQIEYAGKKLAETGGLWPSSPRSLEERLGSVAFVLALIVLVIHILSVAFVFFAGGEANQSATEGGLLPWLQPLALIAAIGVLGVRVLEDGLKPRLEVARYRRYKGELTELVRRFREAPDLPGKLQQMERLEELSYREMRDFLDEQREASFVL